MQEEASPGIASLKKTASLPKLDALKEQAGKPRAVKAEKVEETQVIVEEEANAPADPQALHEAWTDFAQRKKDEGRDQLFMLMNQPYDYREGSILLNLTSPLQEDLVNEFRTEIVQFLRSRLKTKLLSIQTQLVKPEAKRMIYTPLEKFNYLAEKHPTLLMLRDRLGLDPDF